MIAGSAADVIRVRLVRAGATLAALVLLATAASAQNLLSNAEFDAGDQITHWTPDDPSRVSWVSDDDPDGCHLSGGNSGSLQVQGGPDYGGIGVTLWADDCLNIQAGQWVHVEFTSRAVPTGTESVANVFATFLQEGCSGEATVTSDWVDDSGSGGQVPDSWSTLRGHGVFPTDVRSIRVGFVTATNQTIRFDRVYAGLAQRVFADDLDAGTFCRWDTAVSP